MEWRLDYKEQMNFNQIPFAVNEFNYYRYPYT